MTSPLQNDSPLASGEGEAARGTSTRHTSPRSYGQPQSARSPRPGRRPLGRRGERRPHPLRPATLSMASESGAAPPPQTGSADQWELTRGGPYGRRGRGPRAVGVARTTPACLPAWLARCRCHVIPSFAGFCPVGATVSASGLNSSGADQSPPRPMLILLPLQSPSQSSAGSSRSFGTTLPPKSEINWCVSSHV